MPGAKILAVLRVLDCGTQGHAGLTAKHRFGNDVPEILWQDVNHEKIEGVFGIGPMASLDGAGITAAVKKLSGLDLDAPEAAVVLDNEVILGGVSPRLGYVKAVFCGGGHETQLNPLAAPLWLLDLHCQFIHWVPIAKLAKNKKATRVGRLCILPILLLWHFQWGVCAMFWKFIFAVG